MCLYTTDTLFCIDGRTLYLSCILLHPFVNRVFSSFSPSDLPADEGSERESETFSAKIVSTESEYIIISVVILKRYKYAIQYMVSNLDQWKT